jgi:4-hydroxybenzoate polyprenyltransferase
MTAWVRLARPRQWIKNIVLFAGLVFAGRLSSPEYTLHALAAFAVFCCLSSAVYVFNDAVDVAKDRLHPEKRLRPVAAGHVSRGAAVAFAVGLGALGLTLAYLLGPRFGLTATAFILLNLVYSLWLKREVMIDVLAIAVSFLIRAVAGVEVLRDLDPTVALSEWLLLCTFFLALFMALGKRRSELTLLEDAAAEHRKALGDYSVALVDTALPMVTTSAIITYSIYTIWPATVAKLGTDKLVYTIPLVVYGFFRYLFLIREKGLGGNPSEILSRDVPLLVGVLLWIATVVGILYFR